MSGGQQGGLEEASEAVGAMSIQSPTMSIHDAAEKGKVEEVKAVSKIAAMAARWKRRASVQPVAGAAAPSVPQGDIEQV